VVFQLNVPNIKYNFFHLFKFKGPVFMQNVPLEEEGTLGVIWLLNIDLCKVVLQAFSGLWAILVEIVYYDMTYHDLQLELVALSWVPFLSLFHYVMVIIYYNILFEFCHTLYDHHTTTLDLMFVYSRSNVYPH